jgi:rhomboid protease GluP
MGRAGPPAATISVLLATAAITGLQFPFPAILSAVRRMPGALSRGEWWRLITPLFVHPDGWSQIVFNFVAIAVTGGVVERIFGSRNWLILYFGAGFIGQVAGFAWQPSGAGASVGGCGLLGALAAWLLRHPMWRARFGGVVIVVGAAVLTAFRDNHGPPLLAGVCMALIMLWTVDRGLDQLG